MKRSIARQPALEVCCSSTSLISLSLSLDKNETLVAIEPHGEYDVQVTSWKSSGRDIISRRAVTKDGYYIGTEDFAKNVVDKLGLTQLQPTDPDKYNVCQIGYCPKDGKWYGWSHRACYGFQAGDSVKLGDCAYKPKKTKESILEHFRSFWNEPHNLIESTDVAILHWQPNYNLLKKRFGKDCFHNWEEADWEKNFGEQQSTHLWCRLRDEGFMTCQRIPFSKIPTGKGAWTAETEEDAKQMAIDFATSVSAALGSV